MPASVFSSISVPMRVTLSGRPKLAKARLNPTDAPPTDAAILAYAAKHAHASLLVTLGAAGVALVSDVDGRERVIRLEPPLPAATVVDTTGAGDAFVGAFAYGLGIQKGPLAAAALGMACATDSVTREGTQPSFPTPDKCREIFEYVLG